MLSAIKLGLQRIDVTRARTREVRDEAQVSFHLPVERV
jgi:hypothetical protein